MLILKFILFVSFGVLCCATEDDVCEEGRPTHCFADVPDFPIDFPDSEGSLEKLCPVILPRIKCVLDFVKKCPDAALPVEGLDKHLDDIYAVLVEACDKESELNKELAIHLPCIEKNVKGHVAVCEELLKELLEYMTSPLNLDGDTEDSREDIATYRCTKEALGMSCFVASTNVKCGEEAGEIAGSIIDRVGVLDAVCPEKLRDDMKYFLAFVQPLMEEGLLAEEIVSKIE